MDYLEFLRQKRILAKQSGFDVDADKLNPKAFQWQRDVVAWALKKGKCALFEDCGLGKTLQQLMWSGEVVRHTGKPVMIFAPLAVVKQTEAQDLTKELVKYTKDILGEDIKATGRMQESYIATDEMIVPEWLGVA